jgi:endogenous inhibitor of DNA gyrase (YacG/DUF329 family)
MKPLRVVSCPHCGAPVEWKAENHFRPFCSERCKLMDLGAWANEQYRVAGEPARLDIDGDEPGVEG